MESFLYLILPYITRHNYENRWAWWATKKGIFSVMFFYVSLCSFLTRDLGFNCSFKIVLLCVGGYMGNDSCH